MMMDQAVSTMMRKMGGDLKDIRQRAGLSQSERAAACGWKKNAISKIERGRMNLRLFDYLRLMERLHEASRDHPAQGVRAYLAELPLRPLGVSDAAWQVRPAGPLAESR